MNRRGFLKDLGVLAAGFAILPSAQLYTRTWKVQRAVPAEWIINSEWLTAPYEVIWIGSVGGLGAHLYRNQPFQIR